MNAPATDTTRSTSGRPFNPHTPPASRPVPTHTGMRHKHPEPKAPYRFTDWAMI